MTGTCETRGRDFEKTLAEVRQLMAAGVPPELISDVLSLGGAIVKKYEVRKRGLSLHTKGILFWRRRRPYKLPWELLRDGVPVGFYETPAEAESMKADCEQVESRGE